MSRIREQICLAIMIAISHSIDKSVFGVPNVLVSKFWRRVFSGIAAVLVTVALYHQMSETRSAAEKEALDFVRMRGFTSEGYRHTLFSQMLFLLPQFPMQRSLGTVPCNLQVAFTSDRMTNNMADQLLTIEKLEGILLYPAVSDGRAPDLSATSLSLVGSLRDIALPLSEDRIVALERRFPSLRIQVAQKPPEVAADNDEEQEVE